MNWFKDAIVYQILIDRFTCPEKCHWEKPDFMGGTINGIIGKLPYLKELGINTIWISPFYKTSAYHGYHVLDFYSVEPRFGTLNDIKELIKKCHAADMKIIADFVPNHCSSKHPFFLDAQASRDSKYRKWFYWKRWPDDYLCFLSVKELPKLNLGNEECRIHIINAAKYWLSLGFDGFRLDHCIGPKHKFWKEFRRAIKKEYPEAVLIGEAWMTGIKFRELNTVNVRNKYLHWLVGQSSDQLLNEYYGELDGVLDFRFQEIMRDNNNDLEAAKRLLKKHYERFPNNYLLPTFLDNHDMNRFLFECKNEKERLKKAAEIQFSIEQPIIVYYGTESGMTQEKSTQDFPANGDLQVRKPMNWRKADKDILDFYKEKIDKRKNENSFEKSIGLNRTRKWHKGMSRDAKLTMFFLTILSISGFLAYQLIIDNQPDLLLVEKTEYPSQPEINLNVSAEENISLSDFSEYLNDKEEYFGKPVQLLGFLMTEMKGTESASFSEYFIMDDVGNRFKLLIINPEHLDLFLKNGTTMERYIVSGKFLRSGLNKLELRVSGIQKE